MSRIAPYPLRMAPEIRERLEHEAEKSKRSLQQEILYRLDKFDQIERLLSSSSSDNEDIYMQVANALRLAKSVDDKAKEIEALKARVNELMSTLKLSETDRFATISTNAEVIEKAISKIISALPPIPEPIKKPT
ncbi:hypothetical protein H2Y57_00525 [Pectobacterium aroidearum]|uniref:Relaxosome protein TraY n=1 Tax=Pectobacterium aroidearum TaxID=1201031 RepID=A0AAW3SRT2_9GAMM|nr:TraY domain-containing protein [Pectobacterium aroidearum]MBA5202187.1 hypothetical protein [Pectobacterium aroidearum]